MPFRHNVIRQTQACSLPSRFGGEEGVKDFVADSFFGFFFPKF
jgi:hypothetical protein